MNMILIGVVALAAAIALWRFTSGDPEKVRPDTEESKTTWICEKTGKLFKITDRELHEWQETRARRGPEYDAKQSVFMNPELNEYTIVRAVYSKTHDVWYPRMYSDGTQGDPIMWIEQHGGGGGGDGD